MSDPSSHDPEPSPHPDYAHTRDPQAQRSRFELWVIVAIVVAVLAGAFVWRAVTGKRPGQPLGETRTDAVSTPVAPAAAGAGVPPHGVGTPPPRPVAP